MTCHVLLSLKARMDRLRSQCKQSHYKYGLNREHKLMGKVQSSWPAWPPLALVLKFVATFSSNSLQIDSPVSTQLIHLVAHLFIFIVLFILFCIFLFFILLKYCYDYSSFTFNLKKLVTSTWLTFKFQLAAIYETQQLICQACVEIFCSMYWEISIQLDLNMSASFKTNFTKTLI